MENDQPAPQPSPTGTGRTPLPSPAAVNTQTDATKSKLPLSVSLRRVIALAAVVGYVEAIGYTDFGGIYPAIMSGNTVQFGLTVAHEQWTRFALIGFAIAMFFLGGMVAAVIKRHLKKPATELLLMAGLLCIASVVRVHVPNHVLFELPLLALALAMQGETVSRFGTVSLQTIVVTNTMLKFSDAFAARYLIHYDPATLGKRPALEEVLVPGTAWLTYCIGACLGGIAATALGYGLILPAIVLVAVCGDLLRTGG